MNQKLLKQLIHYNPDTGIITWLHRPRSFFKSDRDWKIWNTRYAGVEVSNTCKCNGKLYKRIRILKKDYLQHRIAFTYLHDKTPDEVDHINSNSVDNRSSNLREVNRQTNCKNARLAKDNKSGVNGVTWDSWSNKWLARIGINGKGVNLGRFSNWFDAVCARKSAENVNSYHRNHGKKYQGPQCTY